ncbi:transposase [Sediminicoccus sp. KRV36]|uniref:transposase n=1 Tax=Sediminicoccus sp. KRV36 TaxID=3133721 RepID=UPI00200D37EC|nr:transposase [Sediminicoccus rosea]UPY38584.1 transposase [Sediminicoccus rosea]
MFKKRIPFHNLTDRQWDALRPHLARAAPNGVPLGRPLPDLRHRMNGMFHLLATDAPWREVPAEYGQAGTVARYFRRLTQAGLWERLLQALHDLGPRHPLQGLRRVIFRAARRAYRIRGLGIIVLARRLGFLGALPGPAWMVPDPDLSKTLVALQMRHRKNFGRFVLKWGKALRNLMGMAGGRPHMSRRIRLMMP